MVDSSASVTDGRPQETSPFDGYWRAGIKPRAREEPESGSEEEYSDDELAGVPLSHCFKLKAEKGVNYLKFTPSGNRLFSATRSPELDLYEFQAMNPGNRSPLRSYEPLETHEITKIDINSKSQILALVKDPSFQVLSPEASVVNEFKAGDRYIYDVKQTKGHTDIITDGQFLEHDKIVTSSNDSTFRIWDTTKAKQERVNVVKCDGKKVKVSSVTTLGSQIVAIDSMSRITFWDQNSNFNRPTHTIPSTPGFCQFTPSMTDPNLFIHRSTGLTLYDGRYMDKPLINRSSFEPSSAPMLFHESHILASTGETLHIIDKSDLMTITKIEFPAPITSFDWNTKLNQIAVGTLNSGEISVFFDPVTSRKGVMTSILNKPKKRHLDEADGMTTSAGHVAYNMEELNELRKSKKKKKDHDEGP